MASTCSCSVRWFCVLALFSPVASATNKQCAEGLPKCDATCMVLDKDRGAVAFEGYFYDTAKQTSSGTVAKPGQAVTCASPCQATDTGAGCADDRFHCFGEDITDPHKAPREPSFDDFLNVGCVPFDDSCAQRFLCKAPCGKRACNSGEVCAKAPWKKPNAIYELFSAEDVCWDQAPDSPAPARTCSCHSSADLFDITDQGGGGDCMFLSLAYVLGQQKRTRLSHEQVRQEVANEYCEFWAKSVSDQTPSFHSTFLALARQGVQECKKEDGVDTGFDASDPSSTTCTTYVEQCIKPTRQWGSGDSIAVAAIVYQTRIAVLEMDGQQGYFVKAKFSPPNLQADKAEVWLHYVGDNHYQAARLKSSESSGSMVQTFAHGGFKLLDQAAALEPGEHIGRARDGPVSLLDSDRDESGSDV